MKIEVVMPKMGESLQEGTITKWLKKEGDKIERDEMILEISTDKVDTEVPSPQSGTLVKILAEEGETVEVGEVIAHIETEEGSGTKKAEPEAQEAEKSDKSEETKESKDTEAEETEETETEEAEEEAELEVEEAEGDKIDLVMPKMGESLQEGTITKWLKKEGDKVERDEMILEISTDKVDTEVPSPVGGVLVEILVDEGETVEVGSVIGKVSTGEGGAKPKKKKETKSKPAAKESKEKSTQSKKVEVPSDGGTKEIPSRHEGRFYSPLVRAMAEDKGITLEELNQISGTGSDGRVSKQDLLDYIENRKAAPKKEEKAAPKEESRAITKAEDRSPSIKAPSFPSPKGDYEVIEMDRVRSLIAEHMVYSKQTSPHVTSVGEADVTNIVRFRDKFKQKFQDNEGIKLTFTPFFAKAAVDGLKAFPMVNISVDGKRIIKYNRIHLGFATALDDGNLIVPVIKNADALTITGLQRAVTDLSQRARTKQLDPEDIQGATFTITNVGTFGTLFGTPIINQPNVAIMGIGAIKKRPVVKEYDGEPVIVARDMAYVSITYDHRAVDGMLAGQCLAAIINSLENMNEDTISI